MPYNRDLADWLSDSMTPATFRPVGRTSAAEAVRDQLVAVIKSGELALGDRLPPEQELARSFGVSRPVVREALGSLRALGLVVSQNGRGSFVASAGSTRPPLLGRYSVHDLHEVRLHLEVPGAGFAATRRRASHLERLGELVESLERTTDPAAWVPLDAAFHVALAEATGNQVQAGLVEHLRDLLVDQSLAIVAIDGRIARANSEHRAIYEAVVAGDEAAARRAMSTHLVNVYSI
jgi:GntR family transcriptional regulator, transcriptional repressor for pyruvate dehydrogenase complex